MIDAFELLMQDKVNSEEGFREYIPVSKLQGSILWDEMVEQQKKSLISDIISQRKIQQIMALWKISVKNSGNAACKNKRQRLEKGMFVETSTTSTTPPIGVTRELPMLAQLFMSKYGIEIDPHHMNRSHFDCEKIG